MRRADLEHVLRAASRVLGERDLLVIDVTTAKLPPGWRERLVLYKNRHTTPGRGLCLERHDCVASKLAAFREKDREFADALFEARLVDAPVVRERFARVEDLDPRLRGRVLAWLDGRIPG